MQLLLISLVFGQLPQIADPDLKQMIDKFRIYDLHPAYVHSGGVHDPYYNISMDKPVEPHGNPNLEFPWRIGVGLGTHKCTNTFTRTARYFPLGRKVRVYRNGNVFEGGPGWVFPTGTSFLEIHYQRHDGKEYPWLILQRTKRSDGYPDVFAYGPVVSDDELFSLTKHRCEYEIASKMRNGHPLEVVSAEGDLPILPDLPDEVVAFLLSRPFKRIESFHANAWMPTSKKEFNLVPGNFLGGLVNLDSGSCMECHKSTGLGASQIQGGRSWYGSVRGSLDGFFTWHPFEESCIKSDGMNGPIIYRKELLDNNLLEFYQ